MPTFQKVRDVLARDLSQPIEEVIKLSQTDEQVVYNEIREYVLTDSLRRHYTDLLKAISESTVNPTEGIGVWVSGFFGSGKSSFIKNLGYILANPRIKGHAAADLFIERVRETAPEDHFLPDLIRNLTQRVAFEVIMFDISADRDVRTEQEKASEVMYRALLRHLDYEHQRYRIAELEITLEAEGRLAEFIRVVTEMTQEKGRALPDEEAPVPPTLEGQVDPRAYAYWRRIRSGALGLHRASAALHRLDPEIYPAPESWLKAPEQVPTITVNLLIARTFDLMARRRPGKAVIYIVDEVGQYVARDGQKVLDLQAVVREFGSEGRNRAVRGEIPAPAWVVVTSQEKLGEVVDAIGDVYIDLPKLMDSFRHQIDLGPQDIREVAARRVLRKKPEAVPVLKDLYRQHQGMLREASRLEQSGRFQAVSDEEFVATYPYLPHHIDLSVDIMSALRLQTEGLRHLGGSNRTIIKQAHEMLVNDRIGLADAPLGTLVTFDKLYEIVTPNLSTEKRNDIAAIDKAYGQGAWEGRVARVLALVDRVAHLPRTARNLAVLLYDRLGENLPLAQVETALHNLEKDRFVRQDKDGWKLLTAVEKDWERERRGLRVTPSQQRDALKEALGQLANDPGIRTIQYRNLRAFTPAWYLDTEPVHTRGADFALQFFTADEDAFDQRLSQARQETRLPSHQNEVYWVFPRTAKLEEALGEWARSRMMVQKYSHMASQGHLSREQEDSLDLEVRNRQRWEDEARRVLQEALLQGQVVFRGQARRVAHFHARDWKEALRAVVQWVIPDLYPHLEEGNRPLPPKAGDMALRTPLGELPPVFHEGELGLVQQSGGKWVVHTQAPVAEEILSYIRREQDFGNAVTGQKIEAHFAAPPYGWKVDLLQATLALLLRNGQVEVVKEGRRAQRPDDPTVRRVFQGIRDFRSATFRLRQPVDVRKLVDAVKSLAALAGVEPSAEETTIYEAARTWAQQTQQAASLALTRARDFHLDALAEGPARLKGLLDTLLEGAPEDVVLILAEQRQDLQEAWAAFRRAHRVLSDDKALDAVRRARQILREWWPEIEAEADDLAEAVAAAQEALRSADLPDRLEEVRQTVAAVVAHYRAAYEEAHAQRQGKYQGYVERILALPEWEQVDPEAREKALQPLSRRACATLEWDEEAGFCRACRARLSALRSDLRAAEGYFAEVRDRLRKLLPVDETTPPVVTLRLRDLSLPRRLRTREDVDFFLNTLRDILLRHLEEGEEVEVE